jgi:hypothetical protein
MRNALTPKQEAFAQAYVSLGGNGYGAAAYRQAYDAEGCADDTIYHEAVKLLADPQIAHRVKTLQEAGAARAEVSLAGHLQELERLKGLAAGDDAHSTALRAEELRGKVSGLYKEQIEIAKPRGDLGGLLQALAKAYGIPLADLMATLEGGTSTVTALSLPADGVDSPDEELVA